MEQASWWCCKEGIYNTRFKYIRFMTLITTENVNTFINSKIDLSEKTRNPAKIEPTKKKSSNASQQSSKGKLQSKDDKINEKLHALNISNVSLNCFKIVESVCIVGSSDGFLRAFPLDFSHLLLEVGHGDAITAVDITLGYGKIMSATAEGNLGLLDIITKSYATVTRSHVGKILSVCCDSTAEHLISISTDHTIRIWDFKTYQQLYDYYTIKEFPTAVCSHPRQLMFSCGFSDGSVKVFHTPSLSLLQDIKKHKGKIIGIVYSQDGTMMYTACSYGQLTMYAVGKKYMIIKIFYNMIVGDLLIANALRLSDDNKSLVFVGPSKSIVTLLNVPHLNEKQQINLSLLTGSETRVSSVESILQVQFSPRTSKEILIVTSANRILRVETSNGIILSEWSNIHQGACTALESTAKYLFTAGDSVIKIWDYDRPGYQPKVFIGHLERIQNLLYISNIDQLVSVGEAIFIWNCEIESKCWSHYDIYYSYSKVQCSYPIL